MKYNTLGKAAGIKVSNYCLGTMMFGGQTSEADSLSIMDYAYEHGCNFFDTACNYTEGNSEKAVGKALKGRRDQIILATKVYAVMGTGVNDWGLSRKHIIDEFNASLKRLDTDYVDIYYLHQPDYDTPQEESLEAVSTLVKSGKVRYVGISNYASWQAADALAICDKRNHVPPVICENVYNLITRGIEAEFTSFLDEHPMGMVVYNPIAGGMLTGKHKFGTPETNTRFANMEMYYNRYWMQENFDAVEKLKAIAEEAGISLLELAIKWCAQQPHVTSVISGVSRMSQIEQNMAALEIAPLGAETLKKCDEVWYSLAGTRFKYNR